MSIELQARDLKVLKFVFENRIADYEQVMRLAFDKGKRSIVSRRITALTKHGYLKKISILREDKPGIGLLPTEKALNAIRESWKYEVENPLYKTESPYHDLHLGDLRFCFEKLKYYQNFYPENLLQGFEDVPNDPAGKSF